MSEVWFEEEPGGVPKKGGGVRDWFRQVLIPRLRALFKHGPRRATQRFSLISSPTNSEHSVEIGGNMAPKEMSALLSQLLSFPPQPLPVLPIQDVTYDLEMRRLRKLLGEVSTSTLTGGVPNAGDLLDILNPAINTLPYLYTLLAHILKGKPNHMPIGDQLWMKALVFLDSFDPVQIRYVGFDFRKLLTLIRDAAWAANRAIAAIRPIRTAILRLDPSGSCLTSTHVDFVRLCLEARTFRAAKPVLDNDIYEFPSKETAQTAEMLQLFPCSQHETSSGFITDKSELSDTMSYWQPMKYFLYGGMIYMALREWHRAILFLESVLVTPSKGAASQIQVEAYKKWVLAQLFAYGEVPNMLPKTSHPQVSKQVRVLGKPYESLGFVFKEALDKELDARRLQEEIQAGQRKWAEDCNTSLVNGLLKAYRQFSVVKLGSTYAAMRIPEVSKRTSPTPDDYKETLEHALEMKKNGQLDADIVYLGGPDKYDECALYFGRSSNKESEDFDEQDQREQLRRQTAKCKRLAEHVKATDRKMKMHKDYIDYLKKEQPESTGTTAGPDHPMMTTGGHPFDDEDIMGDS
ncbi:MAG: hypothetical protein Q9183_003282 [Haloplaca sp. 2 TL-2023]